MDRLIRLLGENVTERLEGDSDGKWLDFFCPNDYVSNDYIARASGIIIDTPSSFASSPSSSTPDHRQTLIRACVDAFRSKCIFFLYPRNTLG